MKKELRDAINDYSAIIIKKFNIEIPISSLDDIVRDQLHGNIIEVPELSFDSEGIISHQDESFSISIPENQPNNRKNFTIAHELGHLFLHMGFCTTKWESQSNEVYNRLGNTEEEYEANEFAASLLMPKEIYTSTLKDNTLDGIIDIEPIADFFHVSTIAASNRGKWLNLIEW